MLASFGVKVFRPFLLGLLLAMPALAQGSWTVADNGTHVINSNVGQDTTYRVKSNGPDKRVVVIVRDKNGAVVSETVLTDNTSVDAFVPKEGSIEVFDDETGQNGNTQGASGSYETV